MRLENVSDSVKSIGQFRMINGDWRGGRGRCVITLFQSSVVTSSISQQLRSRGSAGIEKQEQENHETETNVDNPKAEAKTKRAWK